MRWVLRWSLNVAAAVSAVLFVATCVLWVRSYWATDGLQLPCITPTLALWSQRGRALLCVLSDSNLAQGHWVYNRLSEFGLSAKAADSCVGSQSAERVEHA